MNDPERGHHAFLVHEGIVRRKNMNKYIAELIGTMILVFFGTGTAVVTGGFTGGLGLGYLGVVAIALAFGLTIVAGAYAIGHVPGCHET